MIRILDSNALDYLFIENISLREDFECFVPNDIRDEFLNEEGRESWFRRCVFATHSIDESEYLTEYADFLNRYKYISFYSLKGFGDVAILAVINILLKEAPSVPTLSEDLFPDEPIYLVSNDRDLRKFVTKTFPDRVTLETPAEFVAKLRS